MQLTSEQQQFYGAMEGTFRTPGWTLLRKGWIVERDSLAENLFHNAKSMDDVYAARVRYNLLNELIELEASHAAQKAFIEEQELDEMHNV